MILILNLRPKPVHGHGKRVVVNEIPGTIPQPFQQNLSGNDVAGILCQRFQQLVFVWRDRQLFAAPQGRQRAKIKQKKPVRLAIPMSRSSFTPSPDGHLYPPQKNLHVEGLCNIILCAQIESVQHILL